jgi:hypothetical protein
MKKIYNFYRKKPCKERIKTYEQKSSLADVFTSRLFNAIFLR